MESMQAPLTREEKMVRRQEEHNRRQKEWLYLFGKNLSLYLTMLIPFLLIGFIWTDSGLPSVGPTLLSDAAVTVVLFVFAEINMTELGVEGGKVDGEYLAKKEEFCAISDRLKSGDLVWMPAFCRWQIDQEFETYARSVCRSVNISYEEWKENYRNLSPRQLKKQFARRPRTAMRLMLLNRAEPIELTPEMILNLSRRQRRRGGIPCSGEEYAYNKSKSTKHIAFSVITAMITVAISFTLTQDVTFGRVIYTLFKLTTLFCRMSRGYNAGSKAYNTVEVEHLDAKITYCRKYQSFLENRRYELPAFAPYRDKAWENGAEGEEIENAEAAENTEKEESP